MKPLGLAANRITPVWLARRSRRAGRWGLLLVGLLLLMALAAPIIAYDQPIVCRYEGQLHWPATVDALCNIPLVGRFIQKSKPFRFPSFDAKSQLDPDDFAIWPLIRFGPLEMTDSTLEPPSTDHWLGTDDRGRDVMARLVHGAAVSVKVGFISMFIAGLIGVTIGALAGYLGGWTDRILSRLIEMVICFPTFFLILSVMVWMEPNIMHVIVVIGLTQWTAIARFTRAEFLRLRESGFVLAARSAGATTPRIMLRHILPLAMAPILVTLTFGIADAILIEAGLSWLGFGVPTPSPSWGNMLRSAYDQLRSAPYLVYPPCIAIFISVLAFHLVGNAWRRSAQSSTT